MTATVDHFSTLASYRSYLNTNLFDCRTFNSVKELAKRVCLAVTAPFVFLGLAIFGCAKALVHALSYRSTPSRPIVMPPVTAKSNSGVHRATMSSFNLKLIQAFDPTEECLNYFDLAEAIKKINKESLEDWDQEIARLRNKGVLTSTPDGKGTEDVLREQIKLLLRPIGLRPVLDAFKQSKAALVTLGRALEIRELYKKTHYTFFHGQASQWVVMAKLIKVLAKLKKLYPEGLELSEYIRSPFVKVDVEKLRLVIENKGINDHAIRESYLSASAYLPWGVKEESAIDFAVNNWSVMDCRVNQALDQIMRTIFCDFLGAVAGQIAFYRLSNGIKDIIQKYTSSAQSGNLWLFCIPKNRIDNPLFRENLLSLAHPFGSDCKCYTGKQMSQIIEDLQNDKVPDFVKCDPLIGTKSKIPQIRLLAPHLTYENYVHSHIVHPGHPNSLNDMENDLMNLIKPAVPI